VIDKDGGIAANNRSTLARIRSNLIWQNDEQSATAISLSYVYRSAKFDAKFFNLFVRLFILFYFRSEKFRTSVNGKIKYTSERKS